jgi:hypothetical protein
VALGKDTKSVPGYSFQPHPETAAQGPRGRAAPRCEARRCDDDDVDDDDVLRAIYDYCIPDRQAGIIFMIIPYSCVFL